MKSFRNMELYFVFFLILMLSACGGGGGGSGGTAGFNPQMGGSIQGTPLALVGVTSTLAGLPVSGPQDGTGLQARFYSPQGITTDGTNLYVADTNNHTIRKLVIATGAVTTVAGTALAGGYVDGTGPAARFGGPCGITTDGTNLYVADSANHTIRKVVIATGAVTTMAGTAGVYGYTDGTGSAALFNYPRGITTAGTNLYVADTSSCTIRKLVIATGSVTTVAGTAGNSGSTDGPGWAAMFDYPRGLTTDGTNLYVADTSNHTIRKLVIATGAVTTVAGTVNMHGSTDSTGSAALFNYPGGITTDGTNLYIADTRNWSIRKVVTATGVVTTLAGGSVSEDWVDGTGATARFYNPCSITTDGTNLYVADWYNFKIRMVVIATGVVTTTHGGIWFNYPNDITTDGTNLYVADTSNHTIRKVVIATGAVTTVAGTAGTLGSTDGSGAAARFYYPGGITTDGTNLYVADSGNHTIRKAVIATGVVTTVAGAAGVSGSTDGTGTGARFCSPLRLTTDGKNLYVADSGNHTVRKVVIATGAVTTVAGAAGVSGSTDGTGTAARFHNPHAITTDGTNLYVADTSNHTIRKVVTATGVVTTEAGTAGVHDSTDGTGTAARFYYPYGITTDGKNLHVSDSANSTIRKIH